MEKLLTSKDLDFAWATYKKTIEELSDFENKTGVTKKSIVERLRDSTDILVTNGKIPIKREQISSYIWDLLQERKITYHYNTFISLFNENQKRNYSKSRDSLLSHEHNFSGPNPQECQCGVLQYNGLIYELEEVEEKKVRTLEETLEDLSVKEDPYSNPVTEYYQRVAENARELASMADSLVNKYYEDVDTAKLLEDNLPGIQNAIKEQKSLEAELIALSKQMDYRIRIGHFEKIKALLFEKTTKYGIAGIAGLLAPPCIKCGHKGITPKHMSANLMRKDREDILKKLMWFRTIDFNVNGKIIVVDVNEWFNKQVERAELNLDIENPILVSYEAI